MIFWNKYHHQCVSVDIRTNIHVIRPLFYVVD